MTSQPDNICKGCYYYDPYFIRCTKNSIHFSEKKLIEPICFVDPRSK